MPERASWYTVISRDLARPHSVTLAPFAAASRSRARTYSPYPSFSSTLAPLSRKKRASGKSPHAHAAWSIFSPDLACILSKARCVDNQMMISSRSDLTKRAQKKERSERLNHQGCVSLAHAHTALMM